MKMTSSNPVFRAARSYTDVTDKPVTYSNVTIRTVFLLAVAVVSAFITLSNLNYFSIGIFFGAMILAFVSAVIGTMSIRLSPIFSVVYAICEGAVLGIFSLLFASLYQGIVQVALATTLIVLLIMLLLFSSGIIKVTQTFSSVLVIALISVIIMQLVSIIFNFGMQFYTLVVILSAILSAFFLLLSFQNIKYSVEANLDSRVGWVLALGLMVTIVWLYIEILRILAIFSRR